jgi:hypothetical protein
MQALRNASFLTRLMLAWFALSLSLAVASPLVKPVGVELLCSGAGAVKLLVDGGDSPETLTLDCPLCAGSAPPPRLEAASGPWLSRSHAVPSSSSAPVAVAAAGPPPARAPPSARAI